MNESLTPRTDAATHDDWSGGAEATEPEVSRELESELTATRARLAELEGIAEKLKTFRINHGLQHSGICAYRPGQLNMECTCGCDDLNDAILAYKEGKK